MRPNRDEGDSISMPPTITASSVRSNATLSIPQTQNSAPVREHRCLYTHDIRRKQKRWQDGRLKFHTFNKRVMVYDDTSNLIGNTHWKEGGDLPLEEEITLDEGVLVQVGDVLATTQTDLAPLFERERKKPQQEMVLSTNARMMLGGELNAPKVVQKHRSLNALLGAPKGSYGRAQLPQSPFEARKANAENEWEGGPGLKRRKTGAEPWTVTRTTKTSEKTPLWARTADARSQGNMKPPTSGKIKSSTAMQNSLVVTEVMDLTSENDTFAFSDATLPSTPPKKANNARTTVLIPLVCSVKPILPAKKLKSATPARTGPPSPPVSTTNRVRNIDTGPIVIDDDDDEGAASPPKPSARSAARPPPDTKKKQLRIAKTQQRPMLLSLKAIAPPKPKDMLPKESSPDSFAPFSDLEIDIPGWKKAALAKKKSQGPVVKKTASQVSRSSAAFEAASNSPGRRFARRENGISKPSHTVERDQVQGLMDYEMLGPPRQITNNKKTIQPKVTTTSAATFKNRTFRHVQSEGIFEIDEQEDSAIIRDDHARATGKQANSKSKKAPPKASKQPFRRILSANDGLESQTKPSRLKGKAKQNNVPKPPEKKQEVGPWTVEATDLFDWRPPDWEKRLKKKTELEKS